MKNVKTISAYVSAYDLLKENGSCSFDGMTEELKDYYNHFDDYESVKYYLIDSRNVVVVDSVNDSVLNQYDSVELFFVEIGKMYADEKAQDFDYFYDTSTSIELNGSVYSLTIKKNGKTECAKSFSSVSDLSAFIDAVSIGMDIANSTN